MMEGGGSDGGEREWCGVMERGRSPGLVITCVCSLSPMSTHCCLCPHYSPCPRVVAHVCALLPMSACCCLYPCIVACVFVAHISSRSLAVIFVHTQPLLFMGIQFGGWLPLFVGSCLCLWVVAFVCGWLPLFMGGGLHMWVVLLLVQCGGGLLVGGGGGSS